MRPLNLSVILIAAIAVAACSATPAVAPTAPAAQTQNLPADIDVATAASLRGRSDVVMLDVRTPEEYAEGHIPGVVPIPLDQVANRLAEIPKDKTVIVTCRSGNRSNQAAQLLRQKGYDNVRNMLGGINAWQQAGYPVEK
jgi:rhodanese-related sulfurtransferase